MQGIVHLFMIEWVIGRLYNYRQRHAITEAMILDSAILRYTQNVNQSPISKDHIPENLLKQEIIICGQERGGAPNKTQPDEGLPL